MKRLLVVLLLCIPSVRSYSNVTLTSSNGDLSVTVYLPKSVDPDDNAFYESTRFEHGSMIGSIQRTAKDSSSSSEMEGHVHEQDHVREHELYGTDLWRVPHDPRWTESGVGLASEFGVGDDGAFCNYRCGWYGVDSVNNGVLGYVEAKHGEPFLKIGVGLLVKGTCDACDSAEDYRFNSPYRFAVEPQWRYEQTSENSIMLEHEAELHAKRLWGYRLRKEISLEDDQLSVTTTLTNRGQDPFKTPWYSHHFFSCDGIPIGAGYNVELGLKSTTPQIFDEPALWSWSTPLRKYAQVHSRKDSKIDVQMTRTVDPGVKIKAEFPVDVDTDGSFVLNACGTSLKEEIPEVGATNDLSMYAFNLYVERGTLSPEPLLLIHLEPGKSLSWTQRLEFNNDGGERPSTMATTAAARAIVLDGDPTTFLQRCNSGIMVVLAVAALVGLVARVWTKDQSRFHYTPIPDQSE